MVGRQIRLLEEHLGTQLLVRTTRRHSQTEAGRVFYERAKAVLAELDGAEQSVAALRIAPRGLLRVDAPVTFGVHQLAPVLPEYLRRYPEVRVDLTLNNRLVDLVEEGIDAAIRVGDLSDSGLIARPLAPYRLITCAAPAYLALRGRPQTPQELATHACLGFHPGSLTDAWTLQDPNGDPITVRVAGPMASNNGEALLGAAVGGAGIILQAEALVAREIEAGTLVPILEEYQPKALPMHVLYSANRQISPKLRSFVDFLSERFGRERVRRSA